MPTPSKVRTESSAVGQSLRTDGKHFSVYRSKVESRDSPGPSAVFSEFLAGLTAQHLQELAGLQDEVDCFKQRAEAALEETNRIMQERDALQLFCTQPKLHGESLQKMSAQSEVARGYSRPLPELSRPPRPHGTEDSSEAPAADLHEDNLAVQLPTIVSAIQEPCGTEDSSEAPAADLHDDHQAVQQLPTILSATQDEEQLDQTELQNSGEVTAKPSACSKFTEFVRGDRFEVLCCAALIPYVLAEGVQLQYQGMSAGYEIGFPAFNRPAEEAWPGANDVFVSIDFAFTIFFALEVFLRLSVCGMKFWKSVLNWLDFIVVLTSIAELLWTHSGNAVLLRLLRVSKAGRALKLLKLSSIVEGLSVIVRCIRSSMGVLFWSLIFLFAAQILAAHLLVYSTQGYFIDTSPPDDAKLKVFRYCGTYFRAVCTMFELLFANFMKPTWVLVDNVHEGFAIVFIFHRCIIGWAVLNVVNAVFIQSTMKVAHSDERTMMEQKQKDSRNMAVKVMRLFNKLDTSGDGDLSWDEFKAIQNDPALASLAASLELEPYDLEMLFQLLDDGDGQINAAEFCQGILTCKGLARSMDLQHLKSICKRMERKIDQIQDPENTDRKSTSKMTALASLTLLRE